MTEAATEKKSEIAPLGASLKPLLLPEIAIKLLLKAGASKNGEEMTVHFEGESVSLHESDFDLAARVAKRLRSRLGSSGKSYSTSEILHLSGVAHQMVSEEIFAPGAVRVLYYPALTHASAFYRCMLPATTLSKGSKVVAHVSNRRGAREALEYDVVVIQIDHTPAAQNFAKQLKAMGKKVVFELDDAFDALESWHPQYETYSSPEERSWVEAMFGIADLVTVTTEALKERYAELAPGRIEVIPNHIPLGEWPKAIPHETGEFRVLWAGSASHQGDLKVACGPLSMFAKEHENVWVYFFGDKPKEFASPNVRILPFAPFAQYPLVLSQIGADLAIAPLSSNDFNECKSNVKILEYMAAGYPVVASRVRPYIPTPAFTVDDSPKSWWGALELMYKDGAGRESLRRMGDDYVKKFDARRALSNLESVFVNLAEGR